jgi:hypothetical protein
MTVMISNPDEIKDIQGALKEISDSMTRISAEQDLIKEIKATLREEHKDKLTAKQINKLAKTYHKQNYKSEVQEHETFTYLYETISGEKIDE